MKIIVGEWFRLPRLGKDLFIRLMKEVKLEYDKAKGFKVTPITDLQTLAALLKSALGKEIEVVLRCFICGKPVDCPSCGYLKVCDRFRASSNCICINCFENKEAFALYTARFAKSY